MNEKVNALEMRAWKSVNELKNHFVIDVLTAERLHDIFVYLFLSKASKNQRGIDMHQKSLKKVIHGLPVINRASIQVAATQMA